MFVQQLRNEVSDEVSVGEIWLNVRNRLAFSVVDLDL
jgi:hypothetical protein